MTLVSYTVVINFTTRVTAALLLYIYINCNECQKSFIIGYTMLNNYDPHVLYFGD